MPQIQEQILTQQQVQQQRLTPQQLLVVKMVEMPLAQLEENVRSELDINPSLEGDSNDDYDANGGLQQGMDDNTEGYNNADNIGGNDDTDIQEREERQDELDRALDAMGQDDRMETEYSDDFRPRSQALPDDTDRPIEAGNTTSFIETLYEQMRMEDLSERDARVMEYLIGSLDDDGLLRKDLITLSDELAIYHYIDVSEKDIEDVLKVLQTFDPAGIGARSLQECLLLQAERKADSAQKTLLIDMLANHYDDFINNRMSLVRQRMHISDSQYDDLMRDIRKLNPKPGASLSETQGRSTEQITPDFIVHLDYDGRISFELNNGRVPVLHVVEEDEMFLKDMLKRQQELSKGEKEAMAFTQKNVERAHSYIEAIRMRTATLTVTMKAIIDLQRAFFLEGDEADLKPMKLKDVADITNLDLSTISRVCRSKYVMTPWGTFSLRYFFSDAYTTGEGNTMSTKSIKVALRDLIADEDPHHPLSDDKLCAVMKEKGFPIARRTIAKYREQLGIPVARLRRK